MESLLSVALVVVLAALFSAYWNWLWARGISASLDVANRTIAELQDQVVSAQVETAGARARNAILSDQASTQALDAIAAACGCPEWEYPGQVVRDVQAWMEATEKVKAELVHIQGIHDDNFDCASVPLESETLSSVREAYRAIERASFGTPRR